MKIIQVDDFTHLMVKTKATERGMSIKAYIDHIISLDDTKIKDVESFMKKAKELVK